MAIQSFADKGIENFFKFGIVPEKASWRVCSTVASRKLDRLDSIAVLTDLICPPGNRFEELKGNLIGFYSIRINIQWRIVFKWTIEGPAEVNIIDYH